VGLVKGGALLDSKYFEQYEMGPSLVNSLVVDAKNFGKLLVHYYLWHYVSSSSKAKLFFFSKFHYIYYCYI